MAAKYPYLVIHRRKWVVRMTVPKDVRHLIGQAVFRISTKESDIHIAHGKAAPIIAALKKRIRLTRDTLVPPVKAEAAALAARYRELRGDAAERFLLEDVLEFALKQGGHSLTDYGRQLALVGTTVEPALDDATRDQVDLIIGNATPFLAHFEQWKPHAGLRPRPLDQAISSLRSFDAAVHQPIERLEAKHVQAWIDSLINPDGATGAKAVTVARKIGEVRNYWRYLQSVQLVPEDRDPFVHRRIKDPPHRKETRDDKRQKWQPSEVVELWQRAAETDPQLAHAIRLAAYTGSRIEGVTQLKVGDIRIDPETKIRFMRMADKSAAGDRDVPIHPAIAPLIDALIKTADADGYLIHSTAKNKYAERSQPLGKRFGRMKTAMGYDGRFVFHSIRKTVASLFQNAKSPEGVAADIVGHVKPGMTYGLYGGITHMSLRAQELARAVVYPTPANGDASANSTT